MKRTRFTTFLFTRFVPVFFVLAALGAASAAQAEKDRFGYGPEKFDFDPTLVEQWKEAQVPPPAYPDDRDLLAVPLPPSDSVKAYLDAQSLSRALDRVGRYTLVVESPAGARSVFFEGIRCETREYKTYAIGADGALKPVKQPKWQPIPYLERNALRFTLYKHYVCDDASSARTPQELIPLLKYDR